MQSPATISNTPPPLPSMDFSALLNNGIEDCQNLGGDLWTDYNEHDPGVTTLEQLCYAITDLAYRLTFDVADVIAEYPSSAEDPNCALYTGDRILTCNPFSHADYRKLLYDQLCDTTEESNFKNVWFVSPKKPDPHNPELFEIWIEVFDTEGETKNENDKLIRKANAIYQRRRNLGEDVATPSILQLVNITVKGNIEIASTADPNDVLANILYDLQESFSHTPQIVSIDELIQQGVPLDEIYQGPLLSLGAITEAELIDLPDLISLASVSNTILNVTNVVAINDLVLVNDQQQPKTEISISPGSIARLAPSIYQIQNSLPITLTRNGTACAYNADLVGRKIANRFLHRGQSFAYAEHTQKTETYTSLPKGTDRHIVDYYSIQRQFPETYGIGIHGVLQSGCNTLQQVSDRTKREAQAKQFKAYLLFCEQILSNGHAQYANASRLLSLESDLTQSYFCQPLAGPKVAGFGPPDINDLLVTPPADVPQDAMSDYFVFLQSAEADAEILIRSAVVASIGDAKNLRADIIRLGSNIRNYRLQRLPNQQIRYVLYQESTKEILAFSAQRYVDSEPAKAGILFVAGILKNSTETELQKLLVIEARGKCSVQLINANSQILLSANGLTRAQQKLTIQALINNGTHPDNYSIMADRQGLFFLVLRNRRKEELMRGEEKFPDIAAATAGILALIEFIQSICCDPDAQARYIICLPKPQPPADSLNYYEKNLAALVAKYDPDVTRRNEFLNHLMARFAERSYDEELMSFEPPSQAFDEEFQQDLIRHKIDFLRQYVYPKSGDDSRPCMGAGRSQAACSEPGFSPTISGLAMRLQSLLCIPSENLKTTNGRLSAQYLQIFQDEVLYVVESIKLRVSDAPGLAMPSSQIFVIFPAGPIRFQNMEFRKFAEQVVWENCPAHLIASCLWLEVDDMIYFKETHKRWQSRISEGKTKEVEAHAKDLLAFLTRRAR